MELVIALLQLMGLLALVVLLAAGIRWIRVRQLGERTIRDPGDLRELTANLLDYVQEQSYECGQPIALGPFWKGRRLPDGDRHAILEPLFAQLVLLTLQPTDTFKRSILKATDWTFVLVPECVVLSDRDWQRMVLQGLSSWTIVNNLRYTDNRRQEIRQTGDNARAAMGMDAASVQVGDRSALSADDLKRLAAALRQDAQAVDDLKTQSHLHHLADEAEAATTDPSGRGMAVLRGAAAVAALAATTVTNTHDVVDSLRDFLS